MIFKIQLLYGLLPPVILVLFAAACDQSPRDDRQLPDKISFNSHIRPIFSDKCFTCHGPDANKRQADLRLDIAEYAYAPLPENPAARALVPGEPNLSEAFFADMLTGFIQDAACEIQPDLNGI